MDIRPWCATRSSRPASGLSLRLVLEALHTGIAIRPLPLERLSGLVEWSELSMPDALELAAARCWRCPHMISIGTWATATVGDLPGRSPIPP